MTKVKRVTVSVNNNLNSFLDIMRVCKLLSIVQTDLENIGFNINFNEEIISLRKKVYPYIAEDLALQILQKEKNSIGVENET